MRSDLDPILTVLLTLTLSISNEKIGVLRVRADILRLTLNRGFEQTAVFKAKCHYDIQIAWVRN